MKHNTDKQTATIKPELIEEHSCPECGRATIIDETGAVICAVCGLEWEVEKATACQKTPLERLRYHVTGAIERGEAEAIVEQSHDGLADHRAGIETLRKKAAHADKLAEALRAIVAALTQTVQWSDGKGGAIQIIQGDCAVARNIARQAMAEYESEAAQ